MTDETKTPEVKPPEEKKTAPAVLRAEANGMVLGNTLEERYRVSSLYAASGFLPKAYDTPEKVFAGIQYALELGFREQPLTALRNIAIINGQPSIWGEMPLALAMRSKELIFIDEYFEDKKGERLPETCKAEDVWAAVTILERKGFPRRKFAYTQDDRTALGVAAIWKQFTKIMMQRKARTAGLKALFPDILMGINIPEYDNHIYMEDTPDGKVTVLAAKEQKLQDFKDKFKKKDVVDADLSPEQEPV